MSRLSSSQRFFNWKSPSYMGEFSHFQFLSMIPLYELDDRNFSFLSFSSSSSYVSNRLSGSITREYGRQFVAKSGTPIAAHSIVFMKDLQ